jgi:hypothetical protein
MNIFFKRPSIQPLKTFKKFLHECPNEPISEILNKTFVDTDHQMAQKKEIYAGTTAVVAYVRFEDRVVEGAPVKQVGSFAGIHD